MPILAKCDQCGRGFSVKDEWAGRRVKCPGCSAAFTVPGGVAPPSVGDSPARPPAVGQPTAANTPAQPMPGARAKGGPAAPALRPMPSPLLASDPAPLAGKPLGSASKMAPSKKRGQPRSPLKIVAQIAGGVVGVIVAVYACLIVAALIRSGGHPIQATWRADAEARREKDVPLGPVWSPDANIVNLLGPEVNFDQYGWRLPAGFTVGPTPPVTTPAGFKAQNWLWMGAPRVDGSRSIATAFVVESPQALEGAGQLEAALAGAMATLAKTGGLAGFTSTPGEHGVIAGKNCIRSRFSGRLGAATLRGQMLLFFKGQSLVGMSVMSNEPEASTDQQQLEAALLTLRQR